MEPSLWPFSYVWKTAERSAAPAAEYPPGVRARAERGQERHPNERRDLIGIFAPSPSLLNHDWSRQSTARLFEACVSFPAARTLSLGGRGAVWFAIREEFHLSRPGKSCRHRRLRNGQCVARLLL